MNKKIILALLITGFVFVGQSALASSAILSVLPTSATKNVGASFAVNVQIDPAGSKACVVKGTLNFNNLSCSNITVASSLMAQTAPTCASPVFSIGIPKCATDLQNILTVSVKGKSAGQGILSIAGAKVIGAGSDVAFTSQSGEYNIVAVQPKVQAEKPVEKPAVQENTPETQTVTPEPTQESLVAQQPAALANSAPSKVFIIGGIILLLIVIAFGLWKKFSKKKDKQA